MLGFVKLLRTENIKNTQIMEYYISGEKDKIYLFYVTEKGKLLSWSCFCFALFIF